MKEFWIMCADSENGDHYHICASWDHEPSKDEIDRKLIQLDALELEEDNEEIAYNLTIVDGKKYECYAYPTITKIVM